MSLKVFGLVSKTFICQTEHGCKMVEIARKKLFCDMTIHIRYGRGHRSISI